MYVYNNFRNELLQYLTVPDLYNMLKINTYWKNNVLEYLNYNTIYTCWLNTCPRMSKYIEYKEYIPYIFRSIIINKIRHRPFFLDVSIRIRYYNNNEEFVLEYWGNGDWVPFQNGIVDTMPDGGISIHKDLLIECLSNSL